MKAMYEDITLDGTPEEIGSVLVVLRIVKNEKPKKINAKEEIKQKERKVKDVSRKEITEYKKITAYKKTPWRSFLGISAQKWFSKELKRQDGKYKVAMNNLIDLAEKNGVIESKAKLKKKIYKIWRNAGNRKID